MDQSTLANNTASGDLDSSKSPNRSSSRVQLKRAVAGKSYADQVQMLRPPVPMGVEAGSSIQTSADGATSAAAVKNAASAGLQGPSQQTPHLDAIQSSFGGHDVSNVKAHVGGPAADANKAMGSSAYASGNSVAFKESPSLHTAAHEAAHVVQQRNGVSLPGGVGRIGDSYEKNADAVADRVVSGKSAADLLPSGGGSTKGVQQSAVQRAKKKSTSSKSTSSKSTSSKSTSASAQKKSGPGGPPKEGWPEESYKESGGPQHRLYIKTQGKKNTVMENPSPTAIQIKSSTRNTFKIAESVQTKTDAYVLMPDGTEAEKKERKKKLAIIRREMTYLKAAMAKARGEDIPTVNLRKAFEKELGDKAWAGSGVFSVGKTEVDKAITEALNMIRITYEATATNATTIAGAFDKLARSSKFRKMVTGIGTDLKKGYAGAVGDVYTDVKAAVIGGNTDQKILFLSDFGTKFFVPEVTKGTPGNRTALYERVKTQMDPAWFARMKTKIDAGISDKKLIEFRDTDPEYKAAKSKTDPRLAPGREGMDRKRSAQPVENLTGSSLDHLARARGIPLSGCTTDAEKQAELIDKGATVSGGGRGGDADAFVGDLDSGYCQGIIDNVVDGDNFWIKEARGLKMPITSGISGTTRRVLGSCVPLNVNAANVRVAMLGHCIKINMHSFHETMAASAGFPGCTYAAGKYIPFPPITDTWSKTCTMQKIAEDVCSKDAAFAKGVSGKDDTEHQAKFVLGVP